MAQYSFDDKLKNIKTKQASGKRQVREPVTGELIGWRGGGCDNPRVYRRKCAVHGCAYDAIDTKQCRCIKHYVRVEPNRKGSDEDN